MENQVYLVYGPCIPLTDSDSDTEQALTSWPSFLVIKPTNEDTSFLAVSPFNINKALLGIADEMKSTTKLSNGELLVD